MRFCSAEEVSATSILCHHFPSPNISPSPNIPRKCAVRLRYIYPKLHSHQKVFVVPGLFGVMPGDPAEDKALVTKFEKYWSLAQADDRIVGLNPWHYDYDKPDPGSPWINQFNGGAQQYPQLMKAMMAKGSHLPGLHGNPEPWKHVKPPIN